MRSHARSHTPATATSIRWSLRPTERADLPGTSPWPFVDTSGYASRIQPSPTLARLARGTGESIEQSTHPAADCHHAFVNSLRDRSAGALRPVEGIRRVATRRGEIQTIRTSRFLLRHSELSVAAGAFYVPLDQPLANLIIAALEPEPQSSYVSNRLVSLPATAAPRLLPLYRVTAPLKVPMVVWDGT